MQGLIIAFIIISFIYKTYSNYKKEAEKTAQKAKEAEEFRKAAQQPEATTYQKTVFETDAQPSFETTYDKALTQEYTFAPVFENNKEDYKKEKAKQKEDRAAKTGKIKPVLDYSNPEVPPMEVVVNRKIHQPHKHGNAPSSRKVKHLAADFNFKQALIYDAILRRPEY